MIFVIGGPTASGKSSLAIALAKKLNAVIVNADAFQVYKGMNIGTAKNEDSDFGGVPHFLFSYIEPNEEYSIKRYQEDFRKIVKNETRDIVMVGGSGLYIRAALMDYDFRESQNIDMSVYENMSNEELHDYLQQIDPKQAEIIHKNNRKRVLRAIEIYEENLKPKSDIIAEQNHKFIFDSKVFAIDINRENLYENINKRVDEMFDKGLVNEVASLYKIYGKTRAFEGIGYKEVISYLDGDISLNEAKEMIKKNTRNYAKRQVTFFKHQFQTNWIKRLDEIK